MSQYNKNNTFDRNMLRSYSSVASNNSNPFNSNQNSFKVKQDNKNFKDIKKDPEYIKKLDLSYNKCLEELCNIPDWEEKISECKFKFDPESGMSLKSHTFELSGRDNIVIDSIEHNYIFKRSHFYGSFDKPNSFLKRDIINNWRSKGYYVKLHKIDYAKWGLTISWK